MCYKSIDFTHPIEQVSLKASFDMERLCNLLHFLNPSVCFGRHPYQSFCYELSCLGAVVLEMCLQLIEHPKGVRSREGLDCDCSQTLGSGCKTHLQSASGTYVVGYVLDVEKFGKVRAAERSVINTMGTGDDDTWFCPAAIRLKFWGATDDLRFASGYGTKPYGTLFTYTTVKESHH